MPESAVMSGLISSLARSSDYEIVLKVMSESTDAYNYRKPDYIRMERNWRAYSGLDGGSWNAAEMEDLDDQDREAAIFNIVRPKVETLAGHQATMLPDVDFRPVSGPRRTDTESVKACYMKDKELYDYSAHYLDCLRDMAIMAAELKVEVDRSIDGLPRNKLVRKNPAFILRDPFWESNRCKDCESLWDIYHLSAKQLMDLFDAKGPVIEAAYKKWKRSGGDYSETGIDFYGQISREFKGHLFRVIEHHWLDTVKTKKLIGRSMQGEDMPMMSFPITKDKGVLERFKVMYDIDPFSIREIPHKQRIHMVTTVCPSLLKDALLENDKSEVQCDRLPYIHLTTARVNGKDLGIVDSLIYANRHIDQREAKISEMIANGGGAKIANADAFTDPSERQALKDGFNDPKKLIFADGAEFKKGNVIQTIETSGYPEQAATQQLVRMYEIIDRLSHVPAAMESMTESASEPGIVYERKIQVAQIAQYMITMAVKQFVNDVGECYFYQWQRSYNGPTRNITTNDGKYKATLNKKIAVDGEIYVQNVPALTPRCMVIITDAPQNPTKATADRYQLSELFTQMAATHPEYATIILTKILQTYDLDEKLKAKMEQITQLQEARDIAKMRSEIATMDANTAQAMLAVLSSSQQIQQMVAQQQQVMEAPPVSMERADMAQNGGMPRELMAQGPGAGAQPDLSQQPGQGPAPEQIPQAAPQNGMA